MRKSDIEIFKNLLGIMAGSVLGFLAGVYLRSLDTGVSFAETLERIFHL